MKKDFLLEILTQEMPYKFIPSAIKQLEDLFKGLFKENNLDYLSISAYGSPRRLSVIVKGLEESQKDIEKDVKGPILTIAKNEKGEFSPAAIGFAKKNNVDINSLYEKDNYIWAKIKIKGKNAKDILKDNVENLILKIQGAHFMRWGYNSQKFSRPIENVVALLDNEVVDLKIFDKIATNKTKGHRFSSIKEITIDKIENYFDLLKKANVILNQDERRDLIIKSASDCAKKENLKINFEKLDDLLEEITFITEYPVAVMCNFDEKYLKIPSIVTTTVMTSHQRYFPLWDENNNLSNKFITMANYVGEDFSNIKAGNQRVIAARLEDGIFFFEDDTKTKLIDKLENLKGITFQKGLGSLYDKTQRMIKISDFLADKLNIVDKTDILRCATLAKCDLSTKLVFEFTELQGFIGENYALIDNENKKVAKGIKEHYFPLGASSDLASDTIGQIVSIADKIDTICALFISTQENKKRRPTGSNDPLGARRAAIGILRTILEYNLNINLNEIIEYCLNLLSKEFNISLDDLILSEIKDFFLQRLVFMFEKDFSTDTITSLSNSYNPMVNLSSFIEKVKILTKYKNDENFKAIKENALRTKRILKDYSNKTVDCNLFVEKEEKALYDTILNHKEDENYDKYILSLDVFIKPLGDFFEKVLVMDKDEKIKNNRLSLLNLLNDKFKKVCDFEKI